MLESPLVVKPANLLRHSSWKTQSRQFRRLRRPYQPLHKCPETDVRLLHSYNSSIQPARLSFRMRLLGLWRRVFCIEILRASERASERFVDVFGSFTCVPMDRLLASSQTSASSAPLTSGLIHLCIL